jgi:hypothetical protein
MKYILIALIAIIIILLITNPSYKKFEQYTSDIELTHHYDNSVIIHKAIRQRISNYFIFSTYRIRWIDYNDTEDDFQYNAIPKKYQTYLGILGNFYFTH